MAKTPSKKAAKATKPTGDKKKRKKTRVQVRNPFSLSIFFSNFLIPLPLSTCYSPSLPTSTRSCSKFTLNKESPRSPCPS
jgi:hypothetical protein